MQDLGAKISRESVGLLALAKTSALILSRPPGQRRLFPAAQPVPAPDVPVDQEEAVTLDCSHNGVSQAPGGKGRVHR